RNDSPPVRTRRNRPGFTGIQAQAIAICRRSAWHASYRTAGASGVLLRRPLLQKLLLPVRLHGAAALGFDPRAALGGERLPPVDRCPRRLLDRARLEARGDGCVVLRF